MPTKQKLSTLAGPAHGTGIDRAASRNEGRAHARVAARDHEPFSPFSTAVPFGGQTTQILSNLSPERDCSPKRVKLESVVSAYRVLAGREELDVLTERKERNAHPLSWRAALLQQCCCCCCCSVEFVGRRCCLSGPGVRTRSPEAHSRDPGTVRIHDTWVCSA